ncbi:hypothetical protein NBRC116593_29040 [Sulfitobacter pacificus]
MVNPKNLLLKIKSYTTELLHFANFLIILLSFLVVVVGNTFVVWLGGAAMTEAVRIGFALLMAMFAFSLEQRLYKHSTETGYASIKGKIEQETTRLMAEIDDLKSSSVVSVIQKPRDALYEIQGKLANVENVKNTFVGIQT